MVDYTPRLKLPRLDESGTEAQNDFPVIQRQTQNILDESAGAREVTSTTRPSTPYLGQIIFETNTKRAWMWQGDKWRCLTAINVPGPLNLDTASVSDGTIYTAAVDTGSGWQIFFQFHLTLKEWPDASAWTARTLFTGMPPAAIDVGVLGPLHTNITQYPDSEIDATGGGAIRQVSRWSSRSYGSGWGRGSFNYRAQADWTP